MYEIENLGYQGFVGSEWKFNKWTKCFPSFELLLNILKKQFSLLAKPHHSRSIKNVLPKISTGQFKHTLEVNTKPLVGVSTTRSLFKEDIESLSFSTHK